MTHTKKKIAVLVVICLMAFGLWSASPAEAITTTPVPASVSVRPIGPVIMDLGAVGKVTFVPDVAARTNIHYNWGWVTGTAYLNKAETRSMRTYSYAVAVAGGLCAAFGPETLGVACAVTGVMLAQWQYVASNAVGANACIKIRVPIMWAYQYTGGYCS